MSRVFKLLVRQSVSILNKFTEDNILSEGSFPNLTSREAEGAEGGSLSSKDIIRRRNPSQPRLFLFIKQEMSAQQLALSRVAQGGFSYRSVALNAIITSVLPGSQSRGLPVPTLRRQPPSPPLLLSFPVALRAESM